ncbi:neuronal acetylcholine receptor subunit alpha-10-like [Amphiura filiformis]|uniref:neuronal acetylcholine receptor subunit alpha-10-like n=1 Tax=Amphiura filiformis TaxID=82378 RepID=UPI003B20E9B6
MFNKKDADVILVKNVSSLLKLALLVWAQVSVTVCKGSPHQQLRDHLMTNYGDVFIRPVKHTSTLTKVTIRPLFNNLVKMDMKNQYFIMDTRVKLAWTDEFLTWDPAEYNGTSDIRLPSDSVWKPDITFYENVDLSFQRFKSDTVVYVRSTGQVMWFVPVMFVSGCAIRVTWFPYDIQVCDMTFASFGYSGKEIELIPATGIEANQNRYLENGVWDMVATNKKQRIVYYSCCNFSSYEVQYRLIFKRQPDFFIKYLIIPVSLLSFLSPMVFYLPPDSGEKVTLCITNLLALVVFQQIISDNMPPSGAESPIIGSFFLSMITIVSGTVVGTIFVIHINGISHRPVPGWVHWLLLQKLPRLACLDGIKTSRHHSETKPADTESEKLPSKCFYDQMEEENQNRHDWKLVSLVVDRFLMVVLSIVTVVITVTVLVIVFKGSEREFENEMEILNNSWKLFTERWL